MITRREFLKTAGIGAGVVVLNHRRVFGQPPAPAYFALHDFVEQHPDAVFIFKTTVGAKTDTTAIKNAGRLLGNSLFVGRDSPLQAYPITGPIAIKPNLTAWAWNDRTPPVPFEAKMGIHTDPSFVEGIIQSLSDLTVAPANLHIREANYTASATDGAWYAALAQRTGIDLKEMASLPGLDAANIQWTTVPNGVWYTRIPHLWPVNAPGSCLINIAKLKSHSMGITLCSKNLQGTNARPYVAHCKAWNTPISGVSTSDIAPNAFSTIKQNYEAHKDRIRRWKTLDGSSNAGSAGGLWMETHTARCLDNNSVLHPVLNIIEGVYGREGPFVVGPGQDGLGVDIMANVVIFGKNALHVDNIGVYLAGHEPGNFGLFHIARERGLSAFLSPHDIPLYEWTSSGAAIPKPLTAFSRTPIRTLYLPQPGEAQYHMVDQPYDYTTNAVPTRRDVHASPDAIAIEQNFPNPFNPSTSIQYYIPVSGDVRLEILDVRGQLIDVLVDAPMPPGDHLVTWRSEHCASGTYYYRILFGGLSRTSSMILLR
jgi:uncharacterized protein (DUF362 family)